MSIDKNRILIVDDAPDDIHFLMENLKHDYAVLVATNGEKALEMLTKQPLPNVILMDVMMPGMDGYETCRQIKNDPHTKDVDVIFVSAHDSTDEKLAGYEAGGSDYVIKPFPPSEIVQKVQLLIDNRKLQQALEKDKTFAMETAMTAMTSAGELGVVLEFLRQSFTITSVAELAQQVVESIARYSLQSSVQLRSTIEPISINNSGPASPLEQELLSRLRDQGRIMEHGARLILNFGGVSLLIKNMPLDDPDQCGRIRDNVALLAEGAESKLKALEMEQCNIESKNRLQQLVFDSNSALQEIEKIQQKQKEKNMQIMDTVMQQMEASFLSLGLTEEQEIDMHNIVQSGVDKSLNNFEAGIEIDRRLQQIIQNLQSMADN
ncbi:MAG: response regulator [Candidatus Polarisedimenticolaceae bacterium]|nr:response regulator [Candidatus Polarisedimenticolaceae bacterium]